MSQQFDGCKIDTENELESGRGYVPKMSNTIEVQDEMEVGELNKQ